MGEKNELKVRFSTVVCIFIILVLVVALGAVYYFGFVQKDKQLEKIETEKTQVEKQKADLEKQIIVIEKETKNQKTEEKTAKEEVTYESLEGKYTNTKKTSEEKSLLYYLTLYKNGTFQYEMCSDGIPRGYLGNYIINDNKITLVFWFSTASDIRVKATTGTINLKLNTDGTITDNNDLLKESDNNVLLKKDIEESKNIYLEGTKTMVEHLINNGGLMNNLNGNI